MVSSPKANHRHLEDRTNARHPFVELRLRLYVVAVEHVYPVGGVPRGGDVISREVLAGFERFQMNK